MSETINAETEILLNLKKYINEYISLKESQSASEKQNFPPNPLINQTHDMLETVKRRLSHICDHHIVADIIDVDYDRSMCVYYCGICETDFGSKFSSPK